MLAAGIAVSEGVKMAKNIKVNWVNVLIGFLSIAFLWSLYRFGLNKSSNVRTPHAGEDETTITGNEAVSIAIRIHDLSAPSGSFSRSEMWTAMEMLDNYDSSDLRLIADAYLNIPNKHYPTLPMLFSEQYAFALDTRAKRSRLLDAFKRAKI